MPASHELARPAAPRLCGALGRFDPERVRALAGAFGAGLTTVHQDDRSVLLLDREPVRWTGPAASGLAWSEGFERTGRVASWQEAARELSACGLVIDGRRRYLHSSIAGLAPIYWLDDRRATYFSSRIDPLVRTHPGRLSVDWDTWASIFLLGFPPGVETPFAEVHRLGPWSLLENARGRSRVSVERWPWMDVELESVEHATESLVERLRVAIETVPNPSNPTLSGGWDSRLLLCLLSQARGSRLRAWTTNNGKGRREDEEIAAAVASALGVRHEIVEPNPDTFWPELRATVERAEFQRPYRPWLMPVIERLEADGLPVVHGLGGDTWIKGLWVQRETLDAADWKEYISVLWRTLAKRNRLSRGLNDELMRAMLASAKRGLRRTARPFEGHPAGASLTIYRARTVRGISLAPMALFGARLPVATPCTDDSVVTAALAAPPRSKLDGAFYERVLGRVNPAVGALPSTNTGYKSTVAQPVRELSRDALTGYEQMLREHPLRAHLSPKLVAAIEEGDLRKPFRRERPLMRSLAVFHFWHRRYRDHLREVDATELAA